MNKKLVLIITSVLIALSSTAWASGSSFEDTINLNDIKKIFGPLNSLGDSFNNFIGNNLSSSHDLLPQIGEKDKKIKIDKKDKKDKKIASIPEPSTIVLLITGFLGLAATRKFLKK